MAQTSSADRPENAACDALPAASTLKFEVALAELEQLVRNMEGGRLPLEESIAAYRRGSELLKHCQQQLADAERKIQVLENGALRDFDAPADAAASGDEAK
jgi:exodeoxyribonuclease VII small subunit